MLAQNRTVTAGLVGIRSSSRGWRLGVGADDVTLGAA